MSSIATALSWRYQAEIKNRAKADGESAEQLLREMITESARPSREELVRWSNEMSPKIDLETALRIMEEARAERDEGPYITRGLDDH